MEYYSSKKISPTITCITSISMERLYLVEGTTSAVLVDASCGAGDLKLYVESLTSLPVDLVLTHGHMDHIGAAPLFAKAYLNSKDHALAAEHINLNQRKAYIEMICRMRGLDSVPENCLVEEAEIEYLPLEGGQHFDLGGGVSVEALPLVGHTQGSMAILFPHERSILLGDACNPSVFLFSPEASTVREYKASLLAFQRAHEHKYDTVYLSHGTGAVDKAIVTSLIDVCDDILFGNTDDEPFDSPMFKGSIFIAKKTDPKTNMRADGGLGNIIYTKDNI